MFVVISKVIKSFLLLSPKGERRMMQGVNVVDLAKKTLNI